jgi:hypothetical protein
MTATYIPAGFGFNVDQDFARASEDLLLQGEITKQGCWLYAYIAGDPQSKLTFLRPNKVRVKVSSDCVRTVL